MFLAQTAIVHTYILELTLLTKLYFYVVQEFVGPMQYFVWDHVIR
jgi:hypothetical protein